MSEQLRALILGSGVSLNQLSRMCGVDPPRLSRFVRGQRGLSVEALDRICEALDLRLVREPDGQ